MGSDVPLESLVDRVGCHAADIATIDEKNLVARADAGARGRITGRRLPDDHAAVGTPLSEHGPNR